VDLSNRDASKILGNHSGQAILEYILVLVVTVAIILGGLYQLNTAFKSYLDAYFGDYLACLLETGELPAIGGDSGGGNSVCSQAFKSFSLADGKPLLGKGGSKQASRGGTGPTGGSRESGKGGGGASGSYTSGGRFTAGSNFGRGNNSAGRRVASDATGTGNLNASNYGGGYSGGYRSNNNNQGSRIDTRFAFDKESEDKQKKTGFYSSGRSVSGDSNPQRKIVVHRHDATKDQAIRDDQGMTFGNFIRILIIAAIIIALVVLIGGQMLQVGKSME